MSQVSKGNQASPEFLTCYRCGDMTTPETAAVPGLPCCRVCLERNAKPGFTIAILPPRAITRRRARSLAPFALPTLFAGLLLSLALAGPGSPPQVLVQTLLGLFITANLVVIQLMIFTPGRFFFGAVDVWRDDLLASTGLGAAIAGTALQARLALYYIDRPAFLHPGARRTAGLLLENSSGLLFVSAGGLIEAIPFASLVMVETERLWSILPSRIVTILTFLDRRGVETTRRIDDAGARGFSESKARTLALAERCEARLAASPRVGEAPESSRPA